MSIFGSASLKQRCANDTTFGLKPMPILALVGFVAER